jgi:hypothetical protein
MAALIEFDRYDLRARILPAILAILPLLVAVLFCFPGLREIAPLAALGALFVSGAPLLAEFARHREKALDRRLRERGTAPLLLTWIDPEIGPGLKKEIRAALARTFPDFPLLNAREEKAEAHAARILCADVISALEPSFRDARKYPLIQAELMSLRFRRNVLSLRWCALASCGAGALLGLVCAIFTPPGTSPAAISLLAVAICVGAAILFEKAITFSWVSAAEREYVKQLLLAVVSSARASEGGRRNAVETMAAHPRLREEIEA